MRLGGVGVRDALIENLCWIVALAAILVLVADFGWERWRRRKPYE